MFLFPGTEPQWRIQNLMTTETVMFEKNTLLRALLAAGLTTGVPACGGGSSGGASGSEQPPGGETPPAGAEMTEQLVDSPGGGLDYLRSIRGADLDLSTHNCDCQYQGRESVICYIGHLKM